MRRAQGQWLELLLTAAALHLLQLQHVLEGRAYLPGGLTQSANRPLHEP